jgi:two-component system nitrogen regulation response regulator GlnG
MPILLAIDDERNVLYSIQTSLRSDTLDVAIASSGTEGIAQVESLHPDVVILDVRLPDMSGLEVFDRIRCIDPRLPIIVITAYASTETAIEAMKRGAFEFLLKPVDLHILRETVEKALQLSRFRHVPALFDEEEARRDAATPSERIVGRSPVMQEVYKDIGRVAPQDVTVLISGESGTGKELVARSIYHHSGRADKPFLAMNCAAVPETLLESELFGHERGAFTGADRRRIGKFEQAHQGTLFLDEISEISPATQAKLLRILQEQRFQRVGGEETIETDVRVLAATNKDLEKEVSLGHFRGDLFYRLHVFNIHLPPLRERRDDIPLLIEHYVRAFTRTLNRPMYSLTPEVQDFLSAHDWPGNVRQLQSVLKYAMITTPGDVITMDSLPEKFRTALLSPAPRAGPPALPDVTLLTENLLRDGETDIYRRLILAVDRAVLLEVLRHVKGNQVQASQLLGISRTTLRAKLRALGGSGEKDLIDEE